MYRLAALFFLFNLLFAQPQDNFEKAKTASIKETPQKVTPTQKKISIKEATLKAINSLRSNNQICAKATTPLIWNETLYNYAKEHAIDMATHNFIGHDGSGKESDLTAKRLGLKRGSHFYERVNQEKDSKKILSGEIVLAVNSSSMTRPKDVLNYWINREKDCQVIMDERFSDVALAKVVNNKTKKAYWVLLLAGRR